MVLVRPDANEIRIFLKNLANENWLKTSARKWWPQFLFHFTDVNNVAKILDCGKLYSRNRLGNITQDFIDIASPEVIQHTPTRYQSYVRLYFRPRTPTQFRNEGIRPSEVRELGGAHCAIPIFLLFDSYEILSRDDSRFSNGNLGHKNVVVESSLDFLKNLPFEKVYHDRTIFDEDVREITFHKNAEVLIPDELDLSSLRYIVCRSEAEKETLINLLDEDTRLKWLSKIIYNPNSTLRL